MISTIEEGGFHCIWDRNIYTTLQCKYLSIYTTLTLLEYTFKECLEKYIL